MLTLLHLNLHLINPARNLFKPEAIAQSLVYTPLCLSNEFHIQTNNASPFKTAVQPTGVQFGRSAAQVLSAFSLYCAVLLFTDSVYQKCTVLCLFKIQIANILSSIAYKYFSSHFYYAVFHFLQLPNPITRLNFCFRIEA